MRCQGLLIPILLVALVLAGGVLALAPQLLAHSDPITDSAEGIAQYDIQVVAQVGGTASAVAARDDYAYAAIGWRLVTLDISEPAQPKAVGDSVSDPCGNRRVGHRGELSLRTHWRHSDGSERYR